MVLPDGGKVKQKANNQQAGNPNIAKFELKQPSNRWRIESLIEARPAYCAITRQNRFSVVGRPNKTVCGSLGNVRDTTVCQFEGASESLS